MRVALPINGSRVSTVLDFADRLLLADVASGRVPKTREIPFPQTLLSTRVAELRDMGVDTVICGAISNPLASMISHSGIDLVTGITGDVNQVVEAYVAGELRQMKFLLPGFFGPAKQMGRCGRGGRYRGGRGAGWARKAR